MSDGLTRRTFLAGAAATAAGLLLARCGPPSAFDPTGYGITWHSLWWAEDPMWSVPPNRGAVASWRDMSGNGHDATQGTGAFRPGYWNAAASMNGRPCIYGPGQLLTGDFPTVNGPYSFFMIGQFGNDKIVSSAHRAYAFAAAPSGTGAYLNVVGGPTPRYRLSGNGTNPYINSSPYTYDPCALYAVSNGTKSLVGVDNRTLAGSVTTTSVSHLSLLAPWDALPATTSTFDLCTWGPIALAGFCKGDITTNANWASFLSDARAYYGLDSPRALVVCDGDSRTYALSGTSGPAFNANAWPAILDNTLANPVTVLNFAHAGQQVKNMIDDAAGQIDPLFSSPYTRKVVVDMGGYNDVGLGNVDAPTLESRWTTYNSARKNAGATNVIACTVPKGTLVSAGETAREQSNAWLRSNYLSTGADALCDLDADPRLQDPTNTTYYASDQVHFTNAGEAVCAELMKSALATCGVS